jgi:hypothetical protein
VWSNVLYALAGMMSLVLLPKWYGVAVGVEMCAVAGVSVVHHSQENVLGLTPQRWLQLDEGMAGFMGALGAASVIVLWRDADFVTRAIGGTATMLGVLSLGLFRLSNTVYARVALLCAPDPAVGVWGPLLAKSPNKTPPRPYSCCIIPPLSGGDTLPRENRASSCTCEQMQVLYLAYHAMWHVLSGCSAVMWILFLAARIL